MADQQELFVKMALMAWETGVRRAGKVFDGYTDEQLEREVAPGRNRGTYVLGHLVAVNDMMRPLLGLGERLFPQLDNAFVSNPDRSGVDRPDVATLRQYWKTVNAQLAEDFAKLPAAGWFTRHNSMTDDDFAKEPHRNKLSVLLSRTSHLSYHLGQVILLNK